MIILQANCTKMSISPKIKRILLKGWDSYLAVKKNVVNHSTRYPAYLKNLIVTNVIAGPGDLGFDGGTFNPGAVRVDENHILLMARAQVMPWYKARGKYQHLYLEGSPVTFILNSRTLAKVKGEIVTHLHRFPDKEKYSTEDYRLFCWQGKILVNHSLIEKCWAEGQVTQKSVRAALSVFESSSQSLKFLGYPAVDFPLQNFEKNWMYLESGEDLLLLYSVSPYRVLKLQNKESLRFNTVVNRKIPGKINDPGGFGTLVSLSTNPVDFDELHWLAVIHQIEHRVTGRCYYHWAVLISKKSCLPVKMTSKPIFSGYGARGRFPGIRYITSVVKQDGKLLFFAGEGDIYVTVISKDTAEINALLENI